MAFELLRYIDIVLAFALGGVILHALLLEMKPKIFAPFSALLLLLVSSIMLGTAIGGFDYMLGSQRSGSITLGAFGQVRQGNIDFGAYWDVTGTQLVEKIEWGSLFPGQTKNKTLYIKNDDEFPIYCEITTSTWQPANASQYMTLTWDFGDNPLDIGRSRKVILRLMVSSSIHDITDFNFNIIISAQDEPFPE